MKKIDYLNRIVLLASFMIAVVGCGDATEATSNNLQKSDTQTTKAINKPFIKKYAVERATIEYTLTGSMDLMGSTSKTTGSKKLTFSDYGSYEATETNKVENQNIMNNPKTIKTHTLDYIKEATLYKVDFNKKTIQRMEVPALAMMMAMGNEDILTKGQKILKNMGGKKVGSDKVLGYDCDVWSLMGTKQCLYKGIPLKVETNIMGVKTLEVATKAEFDSAVNEDTYALPDFPIVNALSGKSIEKSKLADLDAQDKQNALEAAKRMSELGQTAKETEAKIEAHPNMSQEEKKEIIMEAMSNSKTVQSQLEKQKEMMPKMITLMKSYKKCLQSANSKSDAQSCDKKTAALAKEIGLEDDFSEEEEDERTWTKEGRATIIKEMDQELKMIEGSLPCIEKATNIMDMMNCNQ